MRSAATVFAYGTLQLGAVMRAVTGRDFASAPGFAPGFARFRVAQAVYPGMLPWAGGSVSGAIYRDVDAASLARLDDFEGPLYERRRIEVRCAETSAGASLHAWAWIVPEHHAHRLSREPWELEEFRARHLATFLTGLCSAPT